MRNMYVGCMCMRYLYPVDGIQGNAQILWMTSMVYLDPMDVMEGIYIYIYMYIRLPLPCPQVPM